MHALLLNTHTYTSRKHKLKLAVNSNTKINYILILGEICTGDRGININIVNGLVKAEIK